VLIPKILEIAQLIDGQEYINRVEHEFDDEEGKPKYYNGYYAGQLMYLRIGNDELASEVRNLRRENEALKAQLMELNNGVLPERKPDYSRLLLVPEVQPFPKENRRKKRRNIFVE
jgi:hypothetical protein